MTGGGRGDGSGTRDQGDVLATPAHPKPLRQRMKLAATRTAIYLAPIGAAVGIAGFSGVWRSENALAVIGNGALGAIAGAALGAVLGLLVVGASALLRRQGSSSVSQ